MKARDIVSMVRDGSLSRRDFNKAAAALGVSMVTVPVTTSAMAMGFTGDAFRSRVEGLGSLMGLVASSAIIIIALIDFVGAGAKDRKNSMYALVVAVFSIILVFGLLFLQKAHGETKVSSLEFVP